MKVKIWAIVYPDGSILAESDFRNERDAWQIALGWPDEEEIEDAKKAGYKIVQATVEIPQE